MEGERQGQGNLSWRQRGAVLPKTTMSLRYNHPCKASALARHHPWEDAGSLAVLAPCMVEHEAIGLACRESKHWAWGEGWFEDGVVVSSRSATHLLHVQKARKLPAGVEGWGWGRWSWWGGAGRE